MSAAAVRVMSDMSSFTYLDACVSIQHMFVVCLGLSHLVHWLLSSAHSFQLELLSEVYNKVDEADCLSWCKLAMCRNG